MLTQQSTRISKRCRQLGVLDAVLRLGIQLLVCVSLTLTWVSTTQAQTVSAQFPPPIEDFQQHIDSVRQHLLQHAMPQRTAAAIELNLPFEKAANTAVPYRGKFLLFHGLSDSTYVWHDAAQEITKRGFDVRAILLPGHGSTPRNMLDVSYRQWLSVARKHFALWDQDDTPIYLGGFSLGGVLATILAIENPHIAGLFLISPAYHSKLNHYLRWAWIYAKFKPWIFGGMILEDNPIKYNSIPVNSGVQFFNTARFLKRQWSGEPLKMPVLMVVTEDDSVVDIDHVRERFQSKFSSPKKRLLFYTDNPSQKVTDKETIRNSKLQDARILNQSHLSLLNAPSNPLFGTSRKILVCNGNEYPVFMACLTSPKHWYGAQHTPSPDGVAVARTTYNPDFSFIMQSFDGVFAKAQQ